MIKKTTLFFVIFVLSLGNSWGQTSVSSKVLLQGAYESNSLMRTSLTGLLSNTQPYNDYPWLYPGNESLSSIPVNMVDWILVELRHPENFNIIISQRSALLMNNGEIVDIDQTPVINFPGIPPGNYYLVLFHRNHLAVISESPVSFPNATPYDFSDTLNYPPYGGGNRALVELEPGIFGMIAGDVNKDGTIKYSGPDNDRGPILQYIVNQSGSPNITNTVIGYRDEDVNMDSIIKYSGPGNDPAYIVQDIVGFTGSPSITGTHSTVAPGPFQCGDTIYDPRDGQKYSTVQIGNQCWMAENLAYLPSVYPSDSGSNTSPYFYVYDYQGTDINAAKATSNYQTYGVLYNWTAMISGELSSDSVPSGVQGICPSGWHLPSDEEWKILEGSVDSKYNYPNPEWDIKGTGRGTDVGDKIKNTGSSGFNALFGGKRHNYFRTFTNIGINTNFMSSTVANDYPMIRVLYTQSPYVFRFGAEKSDGYSVRCIKDNLSNCFPEPTHAYAGPDSINIQGDSITLMANTPIIGNGFWTNISGNGGVFSDSTNPSSMFYGLKGGTYYLVWTITTNNCSSMDNVIIGFRPETPPPCPDLANVTHGGMTYNTVQIGSQCWMKENLNIGIKIESGKDQTDNDTIEKYCYNNDTNNCNIYGGLYQWNEMMSYFSTFGAQGICPVGWHIPTDNDWKILEGTIDSQYGINDPEWDKQDLRGLDAGGKLKENGYTHWIAPNTGTTNNSGFTALPGGFRFETGTFSNIKSEAYFWSSTEVGGSFGWYRSLGFKSAQVYRKINYKSYSYSVRCLKDTCTTFPTQADAGSDSLNIPNDSITLMANTPINGWGFWNIISGSGGSFADSTNPTTVFYGLRGNAYNLVWTIKNYCGISADTVLISFVFPNCGVIIDNRDGNSYNTVLIGSQCWMAENLNYTTSNSWCYENDSVNCNIYGKLYTWDAAMAGSASSNSVPSGVQGICPNGWHLPSDAEWTLLTDHLGGLSVAGGKMKEAGTTHWNSPNTGATNSSGFSALPGGSRYLGNFDRLGRETYFWSSTENISITAWSWYLQTSFTGVGRYSPNKGLGFSVRCAEDCSPKPSQSNAGPDSLNIQGDSIQLMGNTPIIGQGLWIISNGNGGSFADSTNPTTMFYGLPGMIYELVWTISNNCGSSSDTVQISFNCIPQPSQAYAGPDSLDIPSDSIALMANTPVTGQGFWTIINGYGASFADSSNATSMFYGIPGIIYELVWTISNNCGSFSDTVVISFEIQIPCNPFVDSRDGITYNTVQIGSQCWMAENLNYSTYSSYCYDNNPANCNIYGRLYSWYRAMDGAASSNSVPSRVKGICPIGWHLPSDEEWKILEGMVDSLYGYPDAEWNTTGYRGTDAGGNLKETGTTHWNTPNTGASNSSGFTAIPAGYRYHNGAFYDFDKAHFWSSTSSSSGYSWLRRLTYSNATVSRTTVTTSSALSVRCIKGCEQPTQANAGTDTLIILSDSIAMMANTPIIGQGLWTIVSGQGGSFADPANPTSVFYGILGVTYELVWTISNNCGNSSDTVQIGFICIPQPSQADAGIDTLNIIGNSITLQANIPINGQGLWAINNGVGGYFADSVNPTTIFYGLPGGNYSLVWTISNNCGISTDTVLIGFAGQGQIEFFDDFELGLNNWEISGNGSWDLTTSNSYSTSNSLTDSPSGDYNNNVLSYITLKNDIDLSNTIAAELSFWAIYDIESGWDYLYVDISTDNFVSYNTLGTFSGSNHLSPWIKYSYDLNDYLGNNIKIRFRFETDFTVTKDGVYIDDFKIEKW